MLIKQQIKLTIYIIKSHTTTLLSRNISKNHNTYINRNIKIKLPIRLNSKTFWHQ